MLTQPQQAAQETELLTDGDLGFTGVNELTQPAQLTPGMVSAALNSRFTLNRADARLGIAKLPWTNRVTSTSLTPQPFAQIWGAIDFRDPNGVEWTIIAADGQVFRTRANNGTTVIPLPAGVSIDAPVAFEQCFDGLIMFRGEGLPELQMTDVDMGFQLVNQTDNTISGAGTENPTDGLEAIPFAANGDWVGNRLFIPFSKDLLGISDYLNPTRYAGVRSQARINQGSEDALVRFFKFNDNAGLAFKERSIYVLNNITGDLSTMTLDEVTREYGLAAAKSCVNVGSDVWFLAERRGICSITQTEQNKLQGRDVPASLPIRDLISRINWAYASQATAAYYDNKYYLAVPIDEATVTGPELVRSVGNYSGGGLLGFRGLIPGATYQWTPGANDTSCVVSGTVTLVEAGTFVATSSVVALHGTHGGAVTASLKRVRSGVNNAVLVYDFLQQQWAGADTGSGICVQEWIESTYEGARRLFCLSADGFINLWEEMPYDETAYETLGANLTPSQFYDVNGNLTVTVETGRQYAFDLGAAGVDTGMINGTQRLTASGSFVAQSNTITLTGVPGIFPATSGVRLVIYVVDVEWIGQDTTLRGWTCESPVQKQYKGVPLGRKRFMRAYLELETWYPQFTIYAITEGNAEQVAVVTDRTKNFLKYDRPWDAANWNPTNAGNDHARRYRQDYAIVLGDSTTASGAIAAGVVYYVEDLTGAASIVYNGVTFNAPTTFTGVAGVTTFTVAGGTPLVYAPGNYFIPGAAGADPDLTQDSTEKYRLPLTTRGQQLQLRIVTTRGRVSVLNASCEAVVADQALGSKI